MTLQLLHSEFFIYEENLIFFLSVHWNSPGGGHWQVLAIGPAKKSGKRWAFDITKRHHYKAGH
jgi:hypothetical protein